MFRTSAKSHVICILATNRMGKLILFLFLFYTVTLFAQDAELDSLLKVEKSTSKRDTVKVNQLLLIAKKYAIKVLIGLVLGLIAGFFWYTSNYYHADQEALNVLDDLQSKAFSNKILPVKVKKDKLVKS